ncbi:tetratricopeptide repeat protein [Coprobacter fastidiosus]|nr:tetratricopeptide repeat protein [Coprobacter fastidiosus]
MLLASFLFVGGVVSSAFAESYTDGIEYFKSGQPDRAKIILDKTLNDPSTKKAEAYFYLGEIYSGMNKLDSAGMYYDMGLQADPLYPYNSIGKGKLMLKNNKKEAEALFKAVIKSDKKNPEIYLAISKADHENVMPEYQKYLDKALDADKEYAPIYVFEGDILVKDKKYGEACGFYEMAQNFDENCLEAYVKYSNIYFPINASLAIAKLEDLLKLKPNSAIAQRELAEAYFKDSKYNQAVEAYARYMANPNHFESDQSRYAALLFFDKKYQESLDLVDKMIVKNPNDFILKRLAMYDNYELKNYDKALTAAETFMNTPGNPQFNTQDYIIYANILIENKLADKAIPVLEKAISLDQEKIELYKELSEAYRAAGDMLKSADAYNEYMKRNQDVSLTDYFFLGTIYYRAASAEAPAAEATPEEKAAKLAIQKPIYQKADSLFAIVAERAPEDYRGHLWRARANSGLDPETTEGLAKPYYEALLTVLEKAQNPNKAALLEAYKYIGFYNYQKEYAAGKNVYPETRKWWSKMLTIDPNNEIKALLDQLPQ